MITERIIQAVYPIVAIIGIVIIEIKALDAGLDGEILLTSVCLIAGIGGYYYGKEKRKGTEAATYSG